MLSPLRGYDIDSNPSRPLRSSPLTTSTIQGLPLELIDRLRSFPLFASAPDTFLAAIGKSLRPQLHQPHDPILIEGEDAKSMYWLVRGSVRVTSRDGESTHAELKPGAFFGEIGILMDIPRTASITANTRSLIVRLNKEDLQRELPSYPDVERAIREEAAERLAILEQKKNQPSSGINNGGNNQRGLVNGSSLRKRSRDVIEGGHDQSVASHRRTNSSSSAVKSPNKRRKSPSPSIAEAAATSVFGKSTMTIRQILQTFPLFSNLPQDSLHYLGINAQPCTFSPFTDIIQQGSQGREVYFIVQGEVEVITESPGIDGNDIIRPIQRVRARIKKGQFFGEVASLLLAPTRTATVRSIDKVECLKITGEVFDELWQQCSPFVRQHMEIEAMKRLENVVSPLSGPTEPLFPQSYIQDSQRRPAPTVTFSEIGFDGSSPTERIVIPPSEPVDPDPFFASELEVPRSKSRRSSLAPPDDENDDPFTSPTSSVSDHSPIRPFPVRSGSFLSSNFTRFMSPPLSPTSPMSLTTSPTYFHSVHFESKSITAKKPIPENILIQMFQDYDIVDLINIRRVCRSWNHLCSTHPLLLNTLDLSKHCRKITDRVMIDFIIPFMSNRPIHININSCFHLTDVGFTALASACGPNAKTWKMRSVWEISGSAILDLITKSRFLEEIDLSNCRKVGDNLLARIIGWITPSQPPGFLSIDAIGLGIDSPTSLHPVSPSVSSSKQNNTAGLGAIKLKRLSLSYCKHVQDRSMLHIANYASERLEVIDLTRCTSITDQGFQHWGMATFPNLRKLVLADCTYLTDSAIVAIANAARNLRELDLVSSILIIFHFYEVNTNE